MIHAHCPGCHARLSIRSEWLNQAIRCTRCGMQVQTKVPGAAAVAVPVAKTVGGVPMGLIPSAAAVNRLRSVPPLSLRLGHGAGTVITPSRRRRRGARVAPLVGWALTLGLLGAGGYVGFNALVQRLEEPTEPESAEPQPVVVGGTREIKDARVDRPKVDPPVDDGKVQPGLFPRRLLTIQISNYLYFNPVNYGPKAPMGMSSWAGWRERCRCRRVRCSS